MLRENRGFTLIEMMVVVAIMAILATVVAGGVTGAGTAGEKAQVQNDAYTIKMAMSSFQNYSVTQSWPSAAIVVNEESGTVTFPSATFNFSSGQRSVTIPISKLSVLGSLTTTRGGSLLHVYESVDWKAQTQVRQKQGNTAKASFVPDFVDAPPDSTRLLSSKDSTVAGEKLPEYLWLLKIGSALDADARTIIVLHLDEKTHDYVRIYPKTQ